MQKIAADFFTFLKQPHEKFKEVLRTEEKWKIFFTILCIDFVFVVLSGGVLAIIDEYILKLQPTELENLFNNESIFFILFMVAFFVPLIEELIFRLYLNYNRNFLFLGLDKLTNNWAKKIWENYFKGFFYFSAFIFGLVHITNYSNNSALFFILIPFIILPQLLGGLIIGYIRLKLGFFWGVLEHGLHNFLIFAGIIFFANTTVLVDQTEVEYDLIIEKMEFGLNKPIKLNTYASKEIIDSIIGKNTTVKDVAEILDSKDTILLKNSNRINIRFINKANLPNSKQLIIKELQASVTN
jgi:membrane protease YdiL (CAAX protease family)